MKDKSYALSNIRPWGADPVDILIEGDRIAGVRPATRPEAGDVDGGGLLAMPGFVNTHAHIDKSWWGKPWVGYTYSDRPTVEGWIANERAQRDKYGVPNVASSAAVLRQFMSTLIWVSACVGWSVSRLRKPSLAMPSRSRPSLSRRTACCVALA
jgi:cytosine deaminase